MLSLEHVRRVLKQPHLSDEETARTRETLYGFADMLVDAYVREHPKENPLPAYKHEGL